MYIGFQSRNMLLDHWDYLFPHENENCCYRCIRIEEKGFGMVASRNIKLGEPILQERPVLSWTNYASLKSQFKHLSKSEKDAVLNLSNSHFELGNELQGIANTNGFFSESTESMCLFLTASRFNHSCIPNIQSVYINPELRVYASCDILKDEELCINYLPLWQSPSTIKQNLKKQYGFVCNCEFCSMEDQGQMKKIMNYRLRYGNIVASLSKKYINGEKIELHSIMQIFETLKKAKLWFPHLILAHSIDGFEIAMKLKMLVKASVFIKRAYKANFIVFGEHYVSNKTFQELIDYLDVDESRNNNKCIIVFYRLM